MNGMDNPTLVFIMINISINGFAPQLKAFWVLMSQKITIQDLLPKGESKGPCFGKIPRHHKKKKTMTYYKNL